MYCAREQQDLPDEQFRFDDRWGWVHESVPRHTVTGYPLVPGRETEVAPTFNPRDPEHSS